MSVSMVTLKDGYQVSSVALNTTLLSMQKVKQESDFIFSDLVNKCKNSAFRFIKHPGGDSKASLTKLGLMDEDGTIHDDIKKIVLNSIEGWNLSLKIVSPIKGEVSKL